jgi:excisionase family DNA binding protein
LPWRERIGVPPKEAAALFGKSVSAVYRLAERGELRLVKFGGTTLVETQSLIAMVDAPWRPSRRAAKARAVRAERRAEARATAAEAAP